MTRFQPLFVMFMAALGGTLANAQLSFGPARNVGEAINTPSIEVGPNLSADGLTLYFVSDRPGGYSGTAELWMSTRATTRDRWRTAVNVGPRVNSYSAASPSISADGLELFFDNGLRVRPGGQGLQTSGLRGARPRSAAGTSPRISDRSSTVRSTTAFPNCRATA